MTQKELLYVEDAYKHECNTIDVINDLIPCLDREELVKFLEKQLKWHESLKKELYNLLEDESNE